MSFAGCELVKLEVERNGMSLGFLLMRKTFLSRSVDDGFRGFLEDPRGRGSCRICAAPVVNFEVRLAIFRSLRRSC